MSFSCDIADISGASRKREDGGRCARPSDTATEVMGGETAFASLGRGFGEPRGPTPFERHDRRPGTGSGHIFEPSRLVAGPPAIPEPPGQRAGRDVASVLGGRTPPPLECLYRVIDPCRFADAVPAWEGGIRPQRPELLWAAAASFAIGGGMEFVQVVRRTLEAGPEPHAGYQLSPPLPHFALTGSPEGTCGTGEL